MLTPHEQAEQDRINKVHAFDLRLAGMSQNEAERLAARDGAIMEEMRHALDALAARSGRETRCQQALQLARGGLAEGCDLAMRRLHGAGENDEYGWGAEANPWMALHPAVEVHALSLALDDLLTPEQRAATRISL